MSGEKNSSYSIHGMFQEQNNAAAPGVPVPNYQQEQQLVAQLGLLDDLYVDITSSPFQVYEEDIRSILNLESHNSHVTETSEGRPDMFPLSSLEILKKHRNRFRRLNEEKMAVPGSKAENVQTHARLSTDNIIKFAAEKFIQSTSHSGGELYGSHPHAGSPFGLSEEDIKDVQLVMYLLASAEKVGEEQYDIASKLLNMCDKLGFNKVSPVQRLVYYFTGALYEKIDRETGKITPNGLGNKQLLDGVMLMQPNPTMIAFYELCPLSHVTQFAGIQAIIEHVSDAKEVHIIDLNICNGIQFTILMQALEGRLKHLKISAVGMKYKHIMEETGRRLKSFAQSFSFNFSFYVVMVADILDLNESLFELDPKEMVAVYASYAFKNMIVMPDRLESLMKVIRVINPCVMVATEVESTDNSPIFVHRFVEALFFYGAFFDSMEECMKHDESNRTIAESKIFGPAIRNIVAAEGEERKIRHVSIDIWRAFFERFGITEIELSMSSIYQANLLLSKFTCGDSYALDIEGKSLIIGWKGTPLSSLSAWRF